MVLATKVVKNEKYMQHLNKQTYFAFKWEIKRATFHLRVCLRAVEGVRDPSPNSGMCAIQWILYILLSQNWIYKVGPIVPS